MATSRGIFDLKYFFTSAIAASHGGEAHSAEAVRHRIKQLIDAENAADVLSDDTIVEKLRAAGVPVSVTRYDGMIHGFFTMTGMLDQGKKAVDEAAMALRKVLSQ